MQIRSLPTVIAFKDGEPISQFLGAMPEGSVRNFISKV
jgi:thioredoxin 1